MSAGFVIPARMEPSVLTLLVVTPASVVQTSGEDIVTKDTADTADTTYPTDSLDTTAIVRIQSYVS